MIKAMGITGELSKFSRTRQAEIVAQSRGIEIDWGARERLRVCVT
jgi:hypothetical protein